jgi:hypothetical protein
VTGYSHAFILPRHRNGENYYLNEHSGKEHGRRWQPLEDQSQHISQDAKKYRARHT